LIKTTAALLKFQNKHEGISQSAELTFLALAHTPTFLFAELNHFLSFLALFFHLEGKLSWPKLKKNTKLYTLYTLHQ
jgi:hypothetical protein